MPNINWNEAVPSDGSQVGIGATDIRRQWSALVEGTDESIDILGTGLVKEGKSFASYGAGNSVYTAEGALRIVSDLSRLLYHASAFSFTLPVDLDTRNQVLLGGTSQLIEHATVPTEGIWLQQSGESSVLSTTGDYAFSYSSEGVGTPNVIYGHVPNIYLTSDDTGTSVSVSSRTQGGFRVRTYAHGASQTTLGIRWMSSGTTGL